MREIVDLLFIHVPKFSSYYKPYGEYMTLNLLPMGSWALADLAVQQGYKTEILHLGLEWIERGEYHQPIVREISQMMYPDTSNQQQDQMIGKDPYSDIQKFAENMKQG